MLLVHRRSARPEVRHVSTVARGALRCLPSSRMEVRLLRHFRTPFRWTVSLCTDTWIFRYTVDATSLAVYSRVSCQELQELQGIRACT